MACPTATVEIARRLLTNWNFGLVLKNSGSYTRHVCTTVATRKMKVFNPFLQISGLCQLLLINICPLTIRKDLPYSISLMLSKIETTGFDYAETNHAPWTKHVSHEQAEGTLPEPLQELLGRSTEHLTVSESERLHELLYNYQHVFSFSIGDLGTTHMVEHRIETGSVPPIRQQPRRTSPWKHEEIVRQVTDLLQEGKVKESSSPWSFPVVLVTKKDGSRRLCIG